MTADGKKTAAVVLAAGSGKRMGTSVHKQYLLIKGKPVIYYTLRAFELSEVDEIILVTGADEIDYCSREIVEKYNFQKVRFHQLPKKPEIQTPISAVGGQRHLHNS